MTPDAPLTGFYAALPATDRFGALAEPTRYADVPPGWAVVLTDVVGSTAAVAAGRYRAVNFAGAAGITALLNLAGDADIPFVFGGDGATVLLPPALIEPARPVLRAVQALVRDDLGLDLRVGLVPVAALHAAGARVAVLRFRASPHYAQALVSGGGLALAERWVKDPATAARYALAPGAPADDPERALLAGLECRWQEVPAAHGEIATWIVAATGADEAATYRRVLGAVEAAYGTGEAAHPVAPAQLRLLRRRADFALEAALRAPRARRAAYAFDAWWRNRLGAVLIRLGLRTSETDWAQYPRNVRAATDFRKFDDALRMVLSGTPAQRASLEAALRAERAAGRLAYGVHASGHATLTCLVFHRMGRQVHFVDGAGGGYTAAARQLKAQLAER